jgi:hypothetical protein
MSNNGFTVEYEPPPRKAPQTYRVVRDGDGPREQMARAVEALHREWEDDDADDAEMADPPSTEPPFRWLGE